MKRLPWQLAPKHCTRPMTYSGTLYIYTPPAHARLPPEPTFDLLATSGADFFSFKTGVPLITTEEIRFYKEGSVFVTHGNKSGRNTYNLVGNKLVHTQHGNRVTAYLGKNGDLVWSHGYSSRIKGV